MNKHLGTVTPFEFEGYWLVALSSAKVLDYLTFDVKIINGRLLIKSNQSIQN